MQHDHKLQMILFLCNDATRAKEIICYNAFQGF